MLYVPCSVFTAHSNGGETRCSQVLQPWADGVEPCRKVIVAFDTGEDNFRHELSPSYKKDRAEAPDALR